MPLNPLQKGTSTSHLAKSNTIFPLNSQLCFFFHPMTSGYEQKI